MAAGKGLEQPLNLSADLEAIVGKGPMSRPAVVKALWAYIKANGLQDSVQKRNINSDEKLKKIFGGKDQVTMFEMNKLISAHLSKPAATAKAA